MTGTKVSRASHHQTKANTCLVGIGQLERRLPHLDQRGTLAVVNLASASAHSQTLVAAKTCARQTECGSFTTVASRMDGACFMRIRVTAAC